MREQRPIRKGRNGCYFCEEPTECIVQVWMREYTAGRDKGGNRRQRTVKSISLSVCRQHGEEFYAKHTADIPVVTERVRDRGDAAPMRARVGDDR